MSTPLLTTKLFVSPLRAKIVPRPRLVARLSEVMRRKLTLISAPAGFGKSTLISEWIANFRGAVAWLSLDDDDQDVTTFLTYVVASLRTVSGNIGHETLGMLKAPQPARIETIMTALVNDMATIPDHVALVLDDYHLVAKSVDAAITFLLEHLPPQIHLIIATREDPQLPLAQLRARGQLTELRAAELRFSEDEATKFLDQIMGLTLSPEDVGALEARTEGWIAGLQLAAISMQDLKDPAAFVKSFSGSHRFVADYLVEEVLTRQPEHVRDFLLRTSILNRLCGPLCDAVVADSSTSGQHTLDYLERANLFIVPLDNERRWYRYHHLFADLLRQRLGLSDAPSATGKTSLSTLHQRASAWYEDNGLEHDAFYHAIAAHDIERAERLIEGKGMPLHFRGVATPVLNWLESLPSSELDARPSLWTAYASVLLVTGQEAKVESALRAAETALRAAEQNENTRDLIGRIAATRATVAANHYEIDTLIACSLRALDHLRPDNLAFRTSTAWKLGFAYQLQGNRVAAGRAYTDVLAIAQKSSNAVFALMAMIGLGGVQEASNQLAVAAETYQCVLSLGGEQPPPLVCEAYLGLARICYEWNDLQTAELHTGRGVELARMIENMDRAIAGEVLLARIRLAQGDASGAADLLARADRRARQHSVAHQVSEVAAAQVLVALRLGNAAAAAELAQTHKLPLSQARAFIAQGDTATALSILEPLRHRAEGNGWDDERLRVLVLRAAAFYVGGHQGQAAQLMPEALRLAEPGGFIRIFVDEGAPIAQLLSKAYALREAQPDYVVRILAAFRVELPGSPDEPPRRTFPATEPLIEPLSPREHEVLHLIACGLSNQEISQRLFLALDTVKGHNRRIFEKLQVQRRTEAVARARQLGLL